MADSEVAIKVQAAFQYTNSRTATIYAFTNGIQNPALGTHVAGFQAALTRWLKGVGESMRGVNVNEVTGDDILPGLTAVIAIEMNKTPNFEGQTKQKLLSREVQGPVQSVIYQGLQQFLAAKKSNMQVAKAIIEHVSLSAEERKMAAKIRQVNGHKGENRRAVNGLLGKLTPVAGGKNALPPAACSLYLVEGDSAAGPAKNARNPWHQW